MTTRVVVADERKARFYDANGVREPLHLRSSLEDPTARLRDRDLETDRPGRSFDRMPAGRHGMDGERGARKQQRIRFAQRIARRIERARARNEFDRLVLVAAPRMLGLIRPHLSDASRALTAAEVRKDLTRRDATEIKTHVPKKALVRKPRPVVPPPL
jgi:protein required for attachment to host cells